MPGIPAIPPQFAELMNNPQFIQSMQQVMQQNPQFMQWAQTLAQDPSLLNQLLAGQIPPDMPIPTGLEEMFGNAGAAPPVFDGLPNFGGNIPTSRETMHGE
eukprot:TRINITY_DN1758_c0_g1_i4.p1 TRINITY_DN1758_c0_g1~~TRINITY_DN1758_c0_g1_i4.p1  ORF type:complete len:101 (-),score=27.55 TRINITY_DN1758_c0_g1_i4:96-398(-)